jgi:hypothetical protein
MSSYAAYEIARQKAEEVLAAQQRKPQPAPQSGPWLGGMASPAGKTERLEL